MARRLSACWLGTPGWRCGSVCHPQCSRHDLALHSCNNDKWRMPGCIAFSLVTNNARVLHGSQELVILNALTQSDRSQSVNCPFEHFEHIFCHAFFSVCWRTKSDWFVEFCWNCLKGIVWECFTTAWSGLTKGLTNGNWCWEGAAWKVPFLQKVHCEVHPDRAAIGVPTPRGVCVGCSVVSTQPTCKKNSSGKSLRWQFSGPAKNHWLPCFVVLLDVLIFQCSLVTVIPGQQQCNMETALQSAQTARGWAQICSNHFVAGNTLFPVAHKPNKIVHINVTRNLQQNWQRKCETINSRDATWLNEVCGEGKELSPPARSERATVPQVEAVEQIKTHAEKKTIDHEEDKEPEPEPEPVLAQKKPKQLDLWFPKWCSS